MPELVKRTDADVLIKAEHVSKKFCRSLKRSLWYGVQDIMGSLVPWKRSAGFGLDQSESVFREPELRSDEFWAVRDVSFEVRRGECLGLIGHNGAGKSTLLKILNSLNSPDAGRITIRGRVSALIELGAGFNPILTGRENIYNQSALLGFSRFETDKKFDSIVDFSELEEFLDMPVQNYSSGMRVRLGFSIAAQMEPDVLILDEILAVGDVAFRLKCINALGRILQSSAVIFVSHSMPQIVRVSTSVMSLNRGEVSYYGSDLRAGIGQYLGFGSRGDKPQVFGSGELVVTSACLNTVGTNAHLGGTINISHGCQPQFQINLSATTEIVDARIQLLIWNLEMIPVMDVVGLELEGHLVSINGQKDVSVCGVLPPLMLNSGRYMISIHANSADLRRNYCRLDNAFYLQIDTASSSGAHLLGVGTWTDCAPNSDKQDSLQ